MNTSTILKTSVLSASILTILLTMTLTPNLTLIAIAPLLIINLQLAKLKDKG